MKTKSCTICDTELDVKAKCKVCDEPTRLFCHVCGKMREKHSHPECLLEDLSLLANQVGFA